jgi:hypothetical protein
MSADWRLKMGQQRLFCSKMNVRLMLHSGDRLICGFAADVLQSYSSPLPDKESWDHFAPPRDFS